MDPDDDLYGEPEEKRRRRKEEDEEDELFMMMAIDDADRVYRGKGPSCMLSLLLFALTSIVLSLICR